MTWGLGGAVGPGAFPARQKVGVFDTPVSLTYNQRGLIEGKTMLYNVAQLLKENIGASRQFGIDGSLYDIDENNPGATRVLGRVKFLRSARGILATGSAHLSLVQACRRCLQLTETEVRFQFEEEFVPSVDVSTGVRLALSSEDSPELVVDEHHTLDLTEVLRQYAILAASDWALCRPDCKGLCPKCGRNLNFGSCNCESVETDPRFAALAELLKAPVHREQID